MTPMPSGFRLAAKGGLMNNTATLMALAALWAAMPASAQGLKSEDEKTLYALGVMVGENVSVFGLSKTELETVKKGFVDGATGAKPQVNVETYKPKVQALAQAREAVK